MMEKAKGGGNEKGKGKGKGGGKENEKPQIEPDWVDDFFKFCSSVEHIKVEDKKIAALFKAWNFKETQEIMKRMDETLAAPIKLVSGDCFTIALAFMKVVTEITQAFTNINTRLMDILNCRWVNHYRKMYIVEGTISNMFKLIPGAADLHEITYGVKVEMDEGFFLVHLARSGEIWYIKDREVLSNSNSAVWELIGDKSLAFIADSPKHKIIHYNLCDGTEKAYASMLKDYAETLKKDNELFDPPVDLLQKNPAVSQDVLVSADPDPNNNNNNNNNI